MATDDLIFRGMVKGEEVKEGEARQNLTLLCSHTVVSGEAKPTKLAGSVAASPEVIGWCSLQD